MERDQKDSVPVQVNMGNFKYHVHALLGSSEKGKLAISGVLNSALDVFALV